MQSLLEYLASAPKTHLAKLHRRDYPEAGLQPAAKVVEAVQARALDAERMRGVLRGLEKEGRRLLLAVYVAEERGMSEAELARGCEGGPSQAAFLLSTLEYELLVFSREGEGRSYHGFREMAPHLVPDLLAEFAGPEAPPDDDGRAVWISNSAHVTSHLCHFLAQAARGELRATQAGELHRKSLQDLAYGFSYGDALSRTVAAEEVVFLFAFAAESGLLGVDDDGVLRLSPLAPAFLDEGRAEIARKLREWWFRRMRGMERTLNALAAVGSAYGVATLAPLFTVYAGWEKRAKASELSTWENLPRPLRELWMLGGVDFAMSKGRIRWGRIMAGADDSDAAHRSAESPRGLPNLEALVPIGAPMSRQFQVELLASRDNDEALTRFRFTKESVVKGLQAGVTAEAMRELAGWLGFEAAARRSLDDWAASYVTTAFREVFMLRVRDGERFRELEEFPQFMELVTEVIPGYGFALPKSAKIRARELLRVFDLLPGEETPAERTLRSVIPDGADSRPSPSFAHGEIAYRHVPPMRQEMPSLEEREKGGRAKAEETLTQRLQTLEAAIHQQRPVEFAYANGAGVNRRVQAQPLHVLRNREPVKLIAVELGTGHRNEYRLDQVQGLRVIEPE